MALAHICLTKEIIWMYSNSNLISHIELGGVLVLTEHWYASIIFWLTSPLLWLLSIIICKRSIRTHKGLIQIINVIINKGTVVFVVGINQINAVFYFKEVSIEWKNQFKEYLSNRIPWNFVLLLAFRLLVIWALTLWTQKLTMIINDELVLMKWNYTYDVSCRTRTYACDAQWLSRPPP